MMHPQSRYNQKIQNGKRREQLPPLPIDAKLWQAVAETMRLSPQHARVVELVLRGLCDKQIVNVMHISKSTLRTHLDRISVRIGAKGRMAILRAVMKISHEVEM